jgi:hypothetical protein
METTKERVKAEIPKRKPNHFFVYNKKDNKYNEIKYISQQDLADGFRQVIPNINISKNKELKDNKRKHLINHFSVTLCFLPEYLWKRLYYEGEGYKTIKDGLTLYSIVETNQDDIMKQLFNEMSKRFPDNMVVEHLVNELDESQHSSWLVIRSNHWLKTGRKYEPEYITI